MAKKAVQRYDIPQGSGCDCRDCEAERSTGRPDLLYPPRDYCTGCGHGYLFAGGGLCTRCGQSGNWSPTKPVLPTYQRPRSTRWEIKTHRAATVVETLTVESAQPITEHEARSAVNGKGGIVNVKCDDAEVTSEQFRIVDDAKAVA